MTTAYLTSTLIIFSLLLVIWKSSNWLNFLIKVSFFGMTIWTLVLQLQHLGYLIKVS